MAKLAGLPAPVIARAQAVLAALEKSGEGIRAAKLIDDLPLFSASARPAPVVKTSAVEEELKAVNPDALTPKEALDLIYRLKVLAAKDGE